jgi:hypothetical protein
MMASTIRKISTNVHLLPVLGAHRFTCEVRAPENNSRLKLHTNVRIQGCCEFLRKVLYRNRLNYRMLDSCSGCSTVFLTQRGEWEFRSLLETPDSTPRKHSATEEDISVKCGFAGTNHSFRPADHALQLPVRN